MNSNFAKDHWKAISIIVVILVVLTGITLFYQAQGYVWMDWTGFGEYIDTDGNVQRGKTLWDWMELLVIPIVLAVGALFFNRQERKNELKIADQRNQEVALQNYLDRMNELILEKGLMEVKRYRDEALAEIEYLSENEMEDRIPNDLKSVRNMAQIRTVTVLRQLDTSRRNAIFQFLRDADLADFLLVNATLDHADLREAKLESFILRGIDMRGANLFGAVMSGVTLADGDLTGANLSWADITGADLTEAHLNEANLFGAILTGASLARAHLSGASLAKTYLSGASLVSAHLSGADLTRSVLIHVTLAGADLSEANLTGANLFGAYLTKANLFKANLNRANLHTANLTRANLVEAKGLSHKQLHRAYLNGTIMPDGSISKKSSDSPPGDQQ